LRIPIVPAAILFDLTNGGDKDWGRYPPYRELGYDAVQTASEDFMTGTVGAGTGALTASFKGGLGTASTVMDNGITIGALVAVNALGSATIGDTRHFWAAPFEEGGEFGGLGMPQPFPQDARDLRIKFRTGQRETQNTTIAVIATDAVLTKAEAKRLAISAHDGFSRALWPSHTPLDGDLVFALATGTSGKTVSLQDFIDLGAVAASTMARAIARGIHDATAAENDLLPAWSTGDSAR
jgi:L-aminopeptidase/D-esterase-like protein